MSQDPISIDRHDAVMVMTLNRPGNRNALSADMKTALHEGACRYRDDREARCLVLTGTEGVFCAGGDLSDMAVDRRTTTVLDRMALTHAALRVLTSCEKPVLCAVNGAAVGAGLSLALAGDLVVAAEDAWFLPGFPKVGVLPDLGLLYHLPRAVGMVQAKDLLFTNRRVSAAEALTMGLVSRVLPAQGFRDAVLELAAGVAAGPTVSMGLAKGLLRGALQDGFDEFLLKERMAQAVVFGTEDFVEGNTAFRQKRAPRFGGR